MLWTMALLVLLTAIVAFFSKEFGGVLGKVFSIPGMFLFAPMLAASWLASYYDDWIWYAFSWLRGVFKFIELSIVDIAPDMPGITLLAKVIMLTVIASIPIFITRFLKTRQLISGARETMQLIAILSWTITSILFLTIKL